MAPNNKILVIVFVVLVLVLTGELAYIFISKNKVQIQKEANSVPSLSKPTASAPTPTPPAPSLPPDVPTDQSYRLQDTPDRLRKFLAKALYGFLIELSDHSPTKTVTVKVDSQYEGTIDSVYQGAEAEKLYPPDPNFPKRDIAAVITVSDPKKVTETRDDIEILIAKIEIPNVKITDQEGKSLDFKDLKGNKVKINRIIELPANKTNDIVTLDPIVYTNIVVLKEK